MTNPHKELLLLFPKHIQMVMSYNKTDLPYFYKREKVEKEMSLTLLFKKNPSYKS